MLIHARKILELWESELFSFSVPQVSVAKRHNTFQIERRFKND